ncbi:MAG: hypothetical protein RBU37_04565 [Myxococcota bacterium]|nr:hypothetical protein [Myxococcota bacterium]
MKQFRIVFTMLLAAAFVLPAMASTAFADDGTAALDYIPKDYAFVVAIDVDGLKKTSIYSDVMKMLQADKDFQQGVKQFKDATGFDVEKDLSSLVIAAPADVEKSENFIFVAKGKVDEKKAIEFAKKEGAAITDGKHEGQSYYVIDKEGGVAFMGGYVVVAPEAALKAAIEVNKGKKDSIKKSSDMSAMLKGVDTKQNIWMMVALPKSIRDEMSRENPLAAGVLNVYGSLGLSSGIDLKLVAGCDKDDTAKSLVDMANAGLSQAMAEPMVAQMGFDVALKKLSIKASGKDIKVGLSLTDAEFTKLKTTVEALMGGAGGF